MRRAYYCSMFNTTLRKQHFDIANTPMVFIDLKLYWKHNWNIYSSKIDSNAIWNSQETVLYWMHSTHFATSSDEVAPWHPWSWRPIRLLYRMIMMPMMMLKMGMTTTFHQHMFLSLFLFISKVWSLDPLPFSLLRRHAFVGTLAFAPQHIKQERLRHLGVRRLLCAGHDEIVMLRHIVSSHKSPTAL